MRPSVCPAKSIHSTRISGALGHSSEQYRRTGVGVGLVTAPQDVTDYGGGTYHSLGEGDLHAPGEGGG